MSVLVWKLERIGWYSTVFLVKEHLGGCVINSLPKSSMVHCCFPYGVDLLSTIIMLGTIYLPFR